MSNEVLTDGWVSNEKGPGSRSWRAKMKVLWQYLHRDMSDARVQRAILYPDTHETHVQRVIPFVWRVAREMASMTRHRTLVDPITGDALPQEVLDVLAEFYRVAGVDAAMTAAYGQTVTLNQATVWLFPHGTDIRCLAMPPHEQYVEMADPLANEEDEVSAWNISIPVRSDPMGDQTEYALARFTAHDITWSRVFDAAAPPPFGADGVNPFGKIPVVFLAGQGRASGSWWCHVPEDLLDAQRAINHDLTDIGHIARLQGYGQMWTAGVSVAEAEKLGVGPEKIVALGDPAARLDFARAQPDLTGYASQNELYMRAVISAEGMNPATFMKSSGITALARKMETQDRDSERLKYIIELEKGEQRIYDLFRLYYRAVRGVDVLPAARVVLEFREPQVPADPLHEAQSIALFGQLGIYGAVASRARLDGIGLEEALKRILRERDLDRSAGIRVGDLFDAEVAPTEDTDQDVQDVEELAVDAGVAEDEVIVTEDVQATALNGAQIASLQGIVTAVAAGELPATAAEILITQAFPSFPAAEVKRLVASAASAPGPITAVLP